MRITVSHNKTKEEVMQAVDRALNDVFADNKSLPVRLVVERKEWQGSTLNFAARASKGLFSTTIKGTAEVTDRDITIEADLGFLERFISGDKAREVIAGRVKGLLA